MNYQDAWFELKDKIEKAEKSLNDLIQLSIENEVYKPPFNERLEYKLSGVKLTKSYMNNIQKLI